MTGCDVVKLGAVSSQSVACFVNTLDLLGKQVRYDGEVGVVVSHCEPTPASKDRLASQRRRSVTIRVEGRVGPHFVEVAERDLERIEVLET